MEESFKIQAIGSNVFVKEVDSTKKDSSVWVSLDTLKDDYTRGVVISVGEGYYNNGLVPMPVEVGDEILFPKTCGTTMNIDGEKFIKVHQDNIIAKINK